MKLIRLLIFSGYLLTSTSCDQYLNCINIVISEDNIIDQPSVGKNISIERIIPLEEPIPGSGPFQFSKSVFFNRFIYCLEPKFDSNRLHQFDKDGRFLKFNNEVFHPIDISKVGGELEIMTYRSLITLLPTGEPKLNSTLSKSSNCLRWKVQTNRSIESKILCDTLYEFSGNNNYLPRLVLDYSKLESNSIISPQREMIFKDGSNYACILRIDNSKYLMVIKREEAFLYNLDIKDLENKILTLNIIGLFKSFPIALIDSNELNRISKSLAGSPEKQYLVVLNFGTLK